MRNVNASLPELVKDFPAEATQIIVRLLNLDDNWKNFAMTIWPEMTMLDIRSDFEQNGMTEAILEKWGKEGATTARLFQILLRNLSRKDITAYLEEKYPSSR